MLRTYPSRQVFLLFQANRDTHAISRECPRDRIVADMGINGRRKPLYIPKNAWNVPVVMDYIEMRNYPSVFDFVFANPVVTAVSAVKTVGFKNHDPLILIASGGELDDI
jgi:hypothetical protein